MPEDINEKFYELAVEVIHIFKQMRINKEKVDPEILKKHFLNSIKFNKYCDAELSDKFFEIVRKNLIREVRNFNRYLSADRYDKIIKLLTDLTSDNFASSLSNIFVLLAKSYMDYHQSMKKMDSFFRDVLTKIAVSNQKMFTIMNENVKILDSDTEKDKEVLGNVKNMSLLAEQDTDFETLKRRIMEFTENVSNMMENKINVKIETASKMKKELVVLKKELEVYKKKTALLENEIIRYKEEAITDDLTELFRKNYMYKKINEMISYYKRKGMIFSLIIMDLDDFKHINDTYGHSQGDLVLKHFASIIQKHIRETDFPFRYGGEEFIVLLEQGSDGYSACLLASRMLQEINDTVFKLKNERIKITASFGVAEFKDNYSPDDLIEEADRNLYLAKQNGKNCIYFEGKRFSE
jgi:diguanylate cyclase